VTRGGAARHPFRLAKRDIKKASGLQSLQSDLGDAGWSSPVARQAHNLKVVGSNPTPATKHNNQNPAHTPRSSPAPAGLSACPACAPPVGNNRAVVASVCLSA
jgi:hypothetical protein